MSADEQLRLLAQIGEADQEHSGPDYLVMPPVVTRRLIPVAWKEKWQPMSPFLLI